MKLFNPGSRFLSLQVKISILIFVIMMCFSLTAAHRMSENVKTQIADITGNYIQSIPFLIDSAIYNFMLNGDRQSIKRLMIQLQAERRQTVYQAPDDTASE